MCRNGVAALSLLPPGTTMNGPKYVQMLSEKLKFHMQVHNCKIFMQDGAPCHRSEVAKNFLNDNNIQLSSGQETARTLIPLRICVPS